MMEKLMPQNIEAEEAVLGSALIDPEIIQVLRWLQPGDFYRDAHRQIWQAMQTLARRRTPPDEVTLCDALQREGKLEDVGGAFYISHLINRVPTSAHAEYYAAIIARMAIARRAVHAAGQIAALAYNELTLDTLEFRRTCLDLVLKATQDHSLSRAVPLSDVLRTLQEETYNRMEGDLEAHLLLPGFHELDRMLVGFERGDLMYLAARPRIGKCLAGTTLLDDPQSGARLTIADYVAQRKTQILGLSKQGTIREALVTQWMYSGVKMCYRVRTRSGRSIETTEHHPFLTVHGWTPLSSLQSGEAIAVPVKVPVFGRDTSWPLSLIRLLAYYIAEGALTHHSPIFTNQDPVLVEDFKSCVAEHFPQCVIRQYNDDYMVSQPRIKGAPFRIPPNPVGIWLGGLGLKGKRAEEKRLPDCVWTWDRTRLVELLRILMSCDGSIYSFQGAPRIEFTVAYQALAQDVQHMLVRLGVRCQWRQQAARAWRVEITESSAVQYYQQEVGWLGEKALRFESHRFSVRKHGNNNGHIPAAIWPKVKATALKKGYSLAALAYASGETVHTGHFNGYNAHVRRNLPRYRLVQYAKVLEDPELQALVSEDIYWDEVVSIEAIGEQEVYDLCVPDGSNFVAQDIIVHNSGLAQAMLLNMARQLARTGGTCDYVTLEMTGLQQARRMVASESQINSSLIRAGFRDVVKGRRDEVDVELFARFTRAVERLREEIGDVVYVQEEGLTVEQLRDHLTEVVTTRDCRLVVVDQLDLFAGPSGRETEQEHVSHISRALKQIAKDLQVVVLCLVQLNRNLESRAGVQGKRPQLSDLRMSGRLEMDADMVLFLHRPCVYEPGLPLAHYDQYTEVWAGKVREGEAGGMVPLCFTGRYATFSDWPQGWLRPALEEDPEGEQAWEARLARLRDER